MQDVRYRQLRPSDRIVDTALHCVKIQINEWSVRDFINHYNVNTPIFVAKRLNEFTHMYYTVEETYIKTLLLLHYQLERTYKVRDFL